jgi:hypothetical protein
MVDHFNYRIKTENLVAIFMDSRVHFISFNDGGTSATVGQKGRTL